MHCCLLLPFMCNSSHTCRNILLQMRPFPTPFFLPIAFLFLICLIFPCVKKLACLRFPSKNLSSSEYTTGTKSN